MAITLSVSGQLATLFGKEKNGGYCHGGAD